MARINLLPWREAARRRRQRDLGMIALISVAMVLLSGFALKVQFDAMLAAQNARNSFLEGQIAVLNRRIREINQVEQRKADLLARMDVIQRLQESRPEIVHLVDELVDAVPAGVFLTSLRQEGEQLTIEGRAQSNARVSALMRNIDASDWVGGSQLVLIENKDETGTGFSHFRLGFKQRRPGSDDETMQAAVD
ncbi:MAG: pilus assembly protein PilN [Gammaproteobacteria bacterium]|jgi:type IV pilus assembly protein PilN|nr:pilus assembly protein PilN [Gammaproteobacteria bacterium]